MPQILSTLNRLREERGATDPILIIAGIAITLILLVGGSFAISGFIANANNLNAKGDLDRIATAQAAHLAETDSYANLRLNIVNPGTTNDALTRSSLGFTATDGNPVIASAFGSGQDQEWVALTKSASGEVYARFSTSSEIFALGNAYALSSPLPDDIQEQVTATGAGAWFANAYARVQGR